MSKVGFPIRRSTGQRLFAPYRSLSQRTTSFIASYRQGIHQMPLGHLIALISNAHRVQSRLSLLRREAASRERTFGSVRIAQKDQKSFRIDPTRGLARARPGTLHTDRLRDQCSRDAPTSTPALRHIPSLRCQESRPRITRGGKVALVHGSWKSGGASRDRTGDLFLGKEAFYH